MTVVLLGLKALSSSTTPLARRAFFRNRLPSGKSHDANSILARLSLQNLDPQLAQASLSSLVEPESTRDPKATSSLEETDHGAFARAASCNPFGGMSPSYNPEAMEHDHTGNNLDRMDDDLDHTPHTTNAPSIGRRPQNSSRVIESTSIAEYASIEFRDTDDDMEGEDRREVRELSDPFNRSSGGNYNARRSRQVVGDHDDGSEPESESLFIPEEERTSKPARGPRVSKTGKVMSNRARRYPHDAPPANASFRRHPAQRPERAVSPPFEASVGQNRRSSRYSGGMNEPWHVNKPRAPIDTQARIRLPDRASSSNKGRQSRDEGSVVAGNDDYEGYEDETPTRPFNNRDGMRGAPVQSRRSEGPVESRAKPKTRIEKVSKAALNKRGLQEGQQEEVLQRGYGINDPENVDIVNMKETDKLSFEQIKDILNERRTKEGRDPKLTTTGVNGRYNRTAPTIFESKGLYFVGLADRKRNPAENEKHGLPISDVIAGDRQPKWEPRHDDMLVAAVREYNAEKWNIVADKFEAKAGFRAPENQLAKRHTLL